MAEVKFIDPNASENYSALSTALGLATGILGIKEKADAAALAKQKVDQEYEINLKKFQKEQNKETEKTNLERAGAAPLMEWVQRGLRPASDNEIKNPKVEKREFNVVQPDGTYKPVKFVDKAPTNDEVAQLLKAEQLRTAQQGTSDERKAAGFTRRLEQAEDVFTKLGVVNFDPTSFSAAVMRNDFTGLSKDTAARQQAQAERNFVNAILRRESGAAISKDEFANAEEQYFPRYGDTPEVLEQKRQNRILAIDNLKNESGKAYSPFTPPKDVGGSKNKTDPLPGITIDAVDAAIKAKEAEQVKQNGITTVVKRK